MMNLSPSSIVALAVLLAASAHADLVITEVGGPPTGSSVKISYDKQGLTGTTSLRYYLPRVGDPDKFDDTATGGTDVEFIFNPPFGAPDSAATATLSKPKVRYFTRDRDLGQTFTIGSAPLRMDALTLRTGPSDNAVRTGALGARVFMQFYKVTGTPVINDHGTTGPKAGEAADGKYTRWATYDPSDPKSDDYIDGETLTPIMTVEGNLPSNPTTFVKNTYLRFEFPPGERPVFEANSVYAWVLAFKEPGELRAMSLANLFHPNDPAKDYPGGHGLRRDGSTVDLEATFVRKMDDGSLPGSERDADVLASKQAAEFPADLAARQAITPGTFGFPDVEGHRDFRFYLQGTDLLPQITTAAGTGGADTFIDSSAATTSQGSVNRARIRNGTAIRKAYFRFDLSIVAPSGAAIDGAELALRITNTDTAMPDPFTVKVHGLNNGDAGEAWSENMTWNSGAPAHGGTNAVTSAATLLGSFSITGGKVAAGQSVVLNHTDLAGLLPFLQADIDKRVTFILTYETSTDKSLDFATKENTTYGGAGLTIAPVVSAGLPQTVVLPDAGNLAGTVDGAAALASGTSVWWSRVSGPGDVGFTTQDALSTSATFSVPGPYVLALTASRRSFIRTAQIAVTVRDSFASWADRTFPPATPAGDKLASANPDHDALTNFKEFALVANPLEESSAQVPTGAHDEAEGTLSLTYRRNLLAAALTYEIWESPDLGPGTWSLATTMDQELFNDGIVQVVKAKVEIGSAPKKFIRLKITGTP